MSEKLVINKDMALYSLEKTVEEHGEDHQVDICQYVENVNENYLNYNSPRYVPLCIVGNALFDMGVSVETLRAMDREDYSHRFAGSGLPGLDREKLPFEMTDSAFKILTKAQEVQDSENRYAGTPRGRWGDALKEARRIADSLTD